ncbi:MAG: hypothetical protein GY756_18070, partial [bacterium]|nr:hypothetical protein [bacterium]
MRYKRPKLRQLKEKAEAGCFDGTAATGKFVLIKKKIKWQIPKLYCADDPSAKPICFSGSGAASGAITCKDGTS